MAPTIERVTESCVLGEGPHWDADDQVLYFVDIGKQTILKYNPSTKKLTHASVGRHVAFIIPLAGKKNQFVIPLDGTLAVISWDGESEQISVVETLGTAATAKHRFNDAKCDSSGRLWAGTQIVDPEFEKTQPLGTLYSLNSKRQLKSKVDKIRIANGLAFNELAKKMYYIDSRKCTIDQFDFEVASGTLSNRQELFTLEKHNIPGFPDGMTIDTDGNLWVAIFEGSRVIKIDGKNPETLLDTIEMPALQVTSMAFGGPNLDELYVTTGAFEFHGHNPLPPVNGATYKITGTGSKGYPGVSFKLD